MASELMRDRVNTARREGIAADDPPNTQQRPPDDPEPDDRLMGVGRASRLEPANPGQDSPQRQLITLDKH